LGSDREFRRKNYPDEQIITFNLKPLVSASILDEKVSEKTSEIAVNSFSIRRLRNKIVTEIEEKKRNDKLRSYKSISQN
jgi:hypothetical protein